MQLCDSAQTAAATDMPQGAAKENCGASMFKGASCVSTEAKAPPSAATEQETPLTFSLKDTARSIMTYRIILLDYYLLFLEGGCPAWEPRRRPNPAH